MTIFEWISKKIPNFRLIPKKGNKFQEFLGKIIFWTDYMNIWTVIYPRIWHPKMVQTLVLQHEAVHLLDMKTFFGLLKRKWISWINVFLYNFLYFFPQSISPLALLGFFNPWLFLFACFLLPLPAPFRMYSELRAYRRSVELGVDVDFIVDNFANASYYFMWPFKRHVRRLLKKSSPYREEMNKIV